MEMMETKNRLLSFIIWTYRNFDGIYATLDSLFVQDYPNIELIISDDGSPNIANHIDSIKEYIEKNKGDNITNVIYNLLDTNVGTVRNANSAIKCSHGYYIKEIGADDILKGKDALSKFVTFLGENKCNICFSKLEGVDTEGNIVKSLESCADDYDVLAKSSSEELRNRLFKRNFLPAPARCVTRDLFEKNGYYFEQIRLIEDYPYWIHLTMQGEKIGFLDEVLIQYTFTGVSSTGNYSLMFMNDMLDIYEQFIFPNDHRYGALQGLYNRLKEMGLQTYVAKAKWKDMTGRQKVSAYIKYWPFFVFISLNRFRYKIKNKRNT